MNTSAEKSLTARIIENLTDHPYLSALIFCVLAEVFTLGDQSYMGAQTSLMTVSGLAAVLIFALREKLRRLPLLILPIIGMFLAAGAFLTESERAGAFVSIAVILSSAAMLFVLLIKKAVTPKRLTALVIYLSFGICTAYILYTYSTFRQTDVGGWDCYSGHAGYINYFIDNYFRLPDFDPRERSQFYHTPLYYLTSAALARIIMLFGTEKIQAVEVCQVISLYSVFCIVITSCKIFRHFGLKGYQFTAAVTIVSMCNALALIGGSVSNDAMSTALELGAVLCALNWYDSGKMSDMIKAALCIGFGMMTKLSAWMAAPAMAFLFILVFIRAIKKKDSARIKKCSLQYIVFLAVCSPLALWFPIYNNIRFGIPLGYVPMGIYNIEQKPVLMRLFTISPKAFTSPVVNPLTFSDEYNPFFTLFKSALDLQRLSKYDSIIPLLTLSLIVSIIIALSGFCFMAGSFFVRRRNMSLEKNIAMVIFYLTIMISYTIFCMKYPFIVTENIRYIYAVVMIGALYYGKGSAFLTDKQKGKEALTKIVALPVVLYAVCFAATFGFLGFIQ